MNSHKQSEQCMTSLCCCCLKFTNLFDKPLENEQTSQVSRIIFVGDKSSKDSNIKLAILEPHQAIPDQNKIEQAILSKTDLPPRQLCTSEEITNVLADKRGRVFASLAGR